jgi:hypothetical protein
MPSSYVLVEAKQNGRGSFQPSQLAKEHLAMKAAAGERTSLLFLILGAPPPIAMKGLGRILPEEAVAAHLPLFFGGPVVEAGVIETVKEEVLESIAWTTWGEIAEVIARQFEVFRSLGHLETVERVVERPAESVTQAVRWHSKAIAAKSSGSYHQTWSTMSRASERSAPRSHCSGIQRGWSASVGKFPTFGRPSLTDDRPPTLGRLEVEDA